MITHGGCEHFAPLGPAGDKSLTSQRHILSPWASLVQGCLDFLWIVAGIEHRNDNCTTILDDPVVEIVRMFSENHAVILLEDSQMSDESVSDFLNRRPK